MIRVGWRLAIHPGDQSRIDAFVCAEPYVTQRQRPENHPEPYAIEVQRLLRGQLKAATRDSRKVDWRYLIAEDADGQVAAAVMHRRAPEIAQGRLAAGIPARLLVAAAVRLDLRGAVCAPDGERLADQAIRLVMDDARRDAAGGVLFAEVHPGNRRMRVVLARNGFELGAETTGGYLLFAIGR